MNSIEQDRNDHPGPAYSDRSEEGGVVLTEIKVILAGVGRVGKDVTRLLSARPNYRIVAAHTRNPKL